MTASALAAFYSRIKLALWPVTITLKTATKKEVVWDTNKAGVDMVQGHEKCTRQLARNAKRNARFLLSLGKTVLYIARIVFQSARTIAAKKTGLIYQGQWLDSFLTC
jgi:hypothetical protein